MVKRNFRKEPLTVDEIINTYWYAVVDDTIGGWSIANADESVAVLNPYEGRFELGSFMTQEEAEHIAEIHNKWYQDKVYKSYYNNIDEALKRAMIEEAFEQAEWVVYSYEHRHLDEDPDR